MSVFLAPTGSKILAFASRQVENHEDQGALTACGHVLVERVL